MRWRAGTMRSSRQGLTPAVRSGASVLWALMLLGFAAVLAQPALGAREQAAQPDDLASLGGCDVALRSFEDVSQLIQVGRQPRQVPTFPAEDASPRRVTLHDVRALLMLFVACSGAGEPLRVWSLYTDGYLARLLSRERGYDRVRYDLDAAPHPIAASDWPVLTALEGIDMDGAGRIAADATIHYPNLDLTKHLRFWFAWEDDQLRIDEVDGEITFAIP